MCGFLWRRSELVTSMYAQSSAEPILTADQVLALAAIIDRHHWATHLRQMVSLLAVGTEPVLIATHHYSLPSAQKIKV